jgi:hypothetical protein
MVPGEGQVHGEVHEYDDVASVILAMDRIEGEGSLYARRRGLVTWKTAEKSKPTTTEFLHPTDKLGKNRKTVSGKSRTPKERSTNTMAKKVAQITEIVMDGMKIPADDPPRFTVGQPLIPGEADSPCGKHNCSPPEPLQQRLSG